MWTSTDYSVILGMQAHTSCTHFIEFLSSMRSNYTLYLYTMPLTLTKNTAKLLTSFLAQVLIVQVHVELYKDNIHVYCKIWLISVCTYSGKRKGCIRLIKDMRLWSVATPTNIWACGRLRACARPRKLASAASTRALLASHCQSDDNGRSYSSESEDSIFLWVYSWSIQYLLNTCNDRWYFFTLYTANFTVSQSSS